MSLATSAELNHAWLSSEGKTYLVSVPRVSRRSAVTELIERIYFAESLRPISRARALLREWIHLSYAAKPSERETVKVTAKRLRENCTILPEREKMIDLSEVPFISDFKSEGLEPGRLIHSSEIKIWLERLKKKSTQTSTKWASDRAVSALLIDSNHRLVAAAWNTNAVIRTRHAESNLCESLQRTLPGGKIPLGSTLYVSLKPCRMCAARIWESALDPGKLAVVYFENDPGPFAQGTLLDAGSSTRRRYLGADHPHFLTVVSRLVPSDSANFSDFSE